MHCKIRHMCVFIYTHICFGLFFTQNTNQSMPVKSWSSMLQQQSTICPTTKWRILQFKTRSYTLLKVRAFKLVLIVLLLESRNILTQQKVKTLVAFCGVILQEYKVHRAKFFK